MSGFRDDLWGTAKWFGTSSLLLCLATALRARRGGEALLAGDSWNWLSVAVPPVVLALITLVGLSFLRRSMHRLWATMLAGWLFATFVVYAMMALLTPDVVAHRTVAALGFALVGGGVFGPLFAFFVWLGLFAE